MTVLSKLRTCCVAKCDVRTVVVVLQSGNRVLHKFLHDRASITLQYFGTTWPGSYIHSLASNKAQSSGTAGEAARHDASCALQAV